MTQRDYSYSGVQRVTWGPKGRIVRLSPALIVRWDSDSAAGTGWRHRPPFCSYIRNYDGDLAATEIYESIVRDLRYEARKTSGKGYHNLATALR